MSVIVTRNALCQHPSSAITVAARTTASRSPTTMGSIFQGYGGLRPQIGRMPTAILTIEVNADSAPFHDRQMAVLTRDRRMAWLDGLVLEDEICARCRQGLSGIGVLQPLLFSQCWRSKAPAATAAPFQKPAIRQASVPLFRGRKIGFVSRLPIIAHVPDRSQAPAGLVR